MSNKSIDILSIDAKDLYISNHYLYDSSDPGQERDGYCIRYRSGPDEGKINTSRFINSLDYSLDLIKLRQVYQKVYRNKKFSFTENGHEYTTKVINVTFKYSNKEFNRVRRDTYVKSGYDINKLTFTDSICLDEDGKLAAIQTGCAAASPAPASVLGKYFYLEDGVYKAKEHIPTLHTVAQLREILYDEGFWCDGLHYIRFKRSSGSARVGKCLFIDERLYRQMHQWECCGLKVKEGQVMDLAAWESYISLTSSSIIGTLEIRPENILLIDDYTSTFQDRVLETVMEDGWLNTHETTCQVSNSIFDGQSLLDISLFGEYEDKGMLLLRNRFFKSCCFNANIQQWFCDMGITDITQLNGRTCASDIKDIRLITTPSSIKYLKFGSFEQWLDNLETSFGIVKYEKPTPFFGGRLVQAHYQLLNTLQMDHETTGRFLEPSFDYLTQLKTNPAVLRRHIRYPEEPGFSDEPLNTKNDITYRLLGINEDFCKTKYYIDFRTELVRSLVMNMRMGHILVKGNYSTMLGNPIEMLKQSIGTFDGTSQLGIGSIHSKNFPYDKVLLGSRSPHVTISNIWMPVNRDNEQIERYINLTKEIVCVNSIGESVLDRLSGADFDSDTVMLIDNDILIDAASKNYRRFAVPVNHVTADKRTRRFTDSEKADLDIRTSVNKIGEIINLSQELNSLFWDRLNNGEPYEKLDKLYCDICQLDIMSGIEIDKAKKEYPIDNSLELRKLKEKYERTDSSGRRIKPNFFGYIARQKGYYDTDKKVYMRHDTTMDHIQKHINSYQRSRAGRPGKTALLPLASILNKDLYNCREVSSRQISRILDLIAQTRSEINTIYADEFLEPEEKYTAAREARLHCSEFLGSMKINPSTVIRLLSLCDTKEQSANYRTIVTALFSYPNADFFKLLYDSRKPVPYLYENSGGDIVLYGIHFSQEIKDCQSGTKNSSCSSSS